MSVSTHCVPQRVCPLGQRHAPSRHISAAMQVLPHAPQLRRSLRVSMHPEPQSFEPDGQAQRPLEQIRPPAHAVIQEPQCSLSRERLTHISSQTVSPALGQPHVPAMHWMPTRHALPQVPQ